MHWHLRLGRTKNHLIFLANFAALTLLTSLAGVELLSAGRSFKFVFFYILPISLIPAFTSIRCMILEDEVRILRVANKLDR